jgi:diguanylate cyclase (GGDEF)-like protein/PAS domain S-box-containing protein
MIEVRDQTRALGEAQMRQYSLIATLKRLRLSWFSLSSLIIPAIGLAASLAVGWAIAYWETQATGREFNAVANNHRQILHDGLRKYEDKIIALRAFFDASGHPISRKEFLAFTEEIMRNSEGIEAFSWVPRVRRDERAAVELDAVKGGFAGYRITALLPEGKPVISEERDEYFPILYSTEPSRDAPIHGLDLGSDLMRRQTLERARDTDGFAATPILELKTGRAGRYGFFVVLPVFKHGIPHDTLEDRRRNLLGFVQGVFQLSPLVDSILHKAAAPERLDIYVFQGEKNANALPLHFHPSRLRTAPARPRPLAALQAGVHWAGELTIDNARLAIVAVPFSDQSFFSRYRDALAIFAAGLLLTGLNQFYLARRRRDEEALRESEGRLDAIFDAAADGVAVAEVESKKLRVVNASFCRMLGYSQEEALNLEVSDLHEEMDLPQIIRAFEQQARGEIDSVIEIRMKRKDGSLFYAQLNTASMVLGGTACMMAIFRDVTERKANEDELKNAHDKLLALVAVQKRHETERALIAQLNDLLQACNSRDEAYPIVAASANELFPGANGALALVTGPTLELETVVQWGADPAMKETFSFDDCWALRVGRVRDVDGVGKDSLCRHFRSAPSGPYVCQPLTIHGETIGLLFLSAGKGDALDADLRQLLFLFGDVIKLSMSNLKLRDTLRDRAIRDPLTGLFNRRYLEETLVRELHQAARRGTSLSVAMLDIDHFKMLNDENGHEAGDEVLKVIGGILKGSTRAGDIACRYGGEEFVLVLNGMDAPTALPRVEQICQAIKRKQIVCGGKSLPAVTVSAGLAEAPTHGNAPEELFRLADKALYAAKNGGRDRVEIYSGQTAQVAASPGL